MPLSVDSRAFEFVSSDLTAGLLKYGHTAIDGATGWSDLGIVFVYSFLIVFVLLGPSEIVLAAPFDLGVPLWGHLDLIMGVSTTGKTVRSLTAFHLGQEAKQADPIVRWLCRPRFDVIGQSERRTVLLARRYGYSDLAPTPCVLLFPDTLSIYMLAILEKGYLEFAFATFVGSLERSVMTLSLFGGVISVLQ